jgi:hypothetical protein
MIVHELIIDIGADGPEIANFQTEAAANEYWDRVVANAQEMGVKSMKQVQFDADPFYMAERRKGASVLRSWP